MMTSFTTHTPNVPLGMDPNGVFPSASPEGPPGVVVVDTPHSYQ